MTGSWRPPGSLVHWSEDAGEVRARFDGGLELTVSWPTEGVCRMRWAPTGQAAPARSWSTLPTFEKGSALPACARHTASGSLLVDCGGMSLQIDPGGNVHVVGSAGDPIFDDRGRGVWWRHDGFEWRICMPATSTYYGCGERTGLLERSGRRYTCWITDRFEGQSPSTDELYAAVPLCIALDAGGHCSAVFVNSTWRSTFDLTALDEQVCAIEAEGPDLEVILIDGPQPASVMERFSALVGRPALPPRWALGYIQSRWSYPSDATVRELAQEFRKRRIPIDVIVLDIDHMDGYRTFTWDRANFADPKRLVEDLAQIGIRLVAVTDCGVKIDRPGRNPVYDVGKSNGYFLQTRDGREFSGFVWPGLSVLPDFTREDVRRWWGRLHDMYAAVGLDGVLADMNEPSLRDRPLDDPTAQRVEVPDDVSHAAGADLAAHAEAHNMYGTLHARAAAEGLRELRPTRRSLVLSRAGFSGIQRFAGVWTGDNWSSWEHLEMSLPQLINLGLSGVSFVGSDIGGFFGHCGPELLIRWMQLGAFYPLMRANNARECTPQEPWAWDQETEAACRRAIELRYQLLPYLYTAFAQSSLTGAPILRPLWWIDPTDRSARSIADEALVGDSLLVAPIVRPGKTMREVYLPAGRWWQWNATGWHDGPGWILADAPLHELAPLFVRDGGIVPVAPVVQSTDEGPVDRLTLHVYATRAETASGELYEDDGVSYAHEAGASSHSRYRYANGELAFERLGGYEPPARRTEIVVHHTDGSSAVTSVEGEEPSWQIRC